MRKPACRLEKLAFTIYPYIINHLVMFAVYFFACVVLYLRCRISCWINLNILDNLFNVYQFSTIDSALISLKARRGTPTKFITWPLQVCRETTNAIRSYRLRIIEFKCLNFKHDTLKHQQLNFGLLWSTIWNYIFKRKRNHSHKNSTQMEKLNNLNFIAHYNAV